MIDLEPDDIDQTWRDGFARMPRVSAEDAPARVEARLTHRQHVRRTRQAVAAVLAVVVVGGGIASLRRSQTTNVGTRGPITRVTVDDGRDGKLRITFPGRQIGDGPQHVILPAGRVVFTVHYLGTHNLVLRGVPGFRAQYPNGHNPPQTVRTSVTLRPGRYLLYCTIPGHQTAGEVAVIVVQDAAVSPPTS